MRWYIVIFIAVLFFIPIPIKIKLHYLGSRVNLYIYRFKIDYTRKKRRKVEKTVRKVKRNPWHINLDDIQMVLNNLSCNKFKPTLRFKIFLNYGLFDASSTGIFYGIIAAVNSLLYNTLNIFFNIKKYKDKIIPQFEDLTLNLKVESIIFLNLAKIINIAIILFKSYRTIKKNKRLAYQCT